MNTNLKRFCFAMTAAVVLLAWQPAAWSQSSQTQGLVNKIDRLQRELQTLQQHVYQGKEPSAADLAAVSSGDAGGAGTARLELRLSQLETEMRNLTGRFEEVNYRIDQLSQRMDRLIADTDLRLQNLENGNQGLSQQPLSSGGQLGSSSAQPPASNQPGVLGSISADSLENQQQVATAPTTPVDSPSPQSLIQGGLRTDEVGGYNLPGDTPKEQYDFAFGLLRQARYDEAEQAFSTFVERNPEDTLAGNATYWLGETYYVRGDYQQAAVTFADSFQRYPNSSKAPDNLLKLGLSLGFLGSASDACGTFGELLNRYPSASSIIKQRATQEMQRLNCQ
ncbi:tol-pal system protein YbgF [Kiloniella laminariae]|uniref:Cell division coordinator CpoB n=1 Tax=Kiloniella laminariae TaxID=454162 RepID=A0ABT4LI70_9PROT|nr:tol-pal system protein YbgF [Kiloniella laminariae]MCZ4280807.1 tol-pal system protein YbgF [Kiloniella laminariae]